MKNRKISFVLGRTYQTDDSEWIKATVGMEGYIEEGKSLESETEKLYENVLENLVTNLNKALKEKKLK